MAFWEGMKNRLNDAGDAFVDKTRRLAMIARADGMMSDIKRDRDRLYSQLGRMFYEDKYGKMKIKTLEKRLAELKDDDPKKTLTLKVLELKQNEIRYEELEEEKKRLKGIVKCPECGNDVTPDSEFCTRCGTRMLRVKAAENAIEKTDEKNDEVADEETAGEDSK